MRTGWLVIAAVAWLGPLPELEISLAHGSAAEAQTREQLQRLLNQYDLSDWVWTRRVIIDSSAIPHSHPTLTLHTRHLHDDLLLLSTFVHEQYHWYATVHDRQTAAAIGELREMYPSVPVGGRDGASSQYSSYLHLIVCYAEYRQMMRLVGPGRARQVMEFWAGDHYRGIYRHVLDDEQSIGLVVARHRLMPER